MDNGISEFFTWQFILFCLSLAALTFVLRKVTEYVLDKPSVPASKTSKLWTELLLPIAPVANGAILAFFVPSYPFPQGITTAAGRVAFGITAGLLSGLVYKVVKGMAKQKAGDDSIDTSSDT